MIKDYSNSNKKSFMYVKSRKIGTVIDWKRPKKKQDTKDSE